MKVLTLCLLVSLLFSSCIQHSNSKTDKVVSIDNANQIPKRSLSDRLKAELLYIKGKEQHLIEIPPNTPSDMIKASKMYKTCIELLNEADSSKEIKKLKDDIRRQLIVSQQRLFPKLRDAYFNFTKNLLWKIDIDVSLSGKNKTILTLVGSVYARNIHKQETMESMREALYALRFKRVNFKWIRHDDEYTYYNIDAPLDNILEHPLL